MSRLETHQQKVFLSQIAFFAALLILIFVFIFTIGIKLLLNTSLFINQVFDKDKLTVTPSKEEFKGEFSVDQIPSATNSAKIIVSGSISNYDTVAVYLNKEKKEETKIASNSFSLEIGDLIKGENEIYFLAKSQKKKQEKQSEVFKVIFKDEKPKLEISEPTDGLKTYIQDQKITGTTDKENTVRVNSLPVVVAANASFQTSVKLHDGENKITIDVTDEFGNSDSKTLTVTYQKD